MTTKYFLLSSIMTLDAYIFVSHLDKFKVFYFVIDMMALPPYAGS